MWWQSIPIIGKVLTGVLDIVDQGIEDKDKANQIKADLTQAFNNADLTRFQTVIENASKIILGEIQGESWLQRNWRPILMMSIVAIVVNNYLIFPYLTLWTDKVVILELPERLFQLMTIGVGGYVVGRTVEKGIDKWKNKPPIE